MSFLSDARQLLGKYIKNRFLILAGAYLLWRFVNKQKKKEGYAESIAIVTDDIIFDKKTNKYILIKNDRVFTSEDKNKLIKMTR